MITIEWPPSTERPFTMNEFSSSAEALAGLFASYGRVESGKKGSRPSRALEGITNIDLAMTTGGAGGGVTLAGSPKAAGTPAAASATIRDFFIKVFMYFNW